MALFGGKENGMRESIKRLQEQLGMDDGELLRLARDVADAHEILSIDELTAREQARLIAYLDCLRLTEVR